MNLDFIKTEIHLILRIHADIFTQNINVDLIKLQYFEYLEHLHKLQSQQIEKAQIKLCSCKHGIGKK